MNVWIVLIALIVLIKCWALNPVFVETTYSQSFYPIISNLLRILTGWIPFSLGDLLYALAVILLARVLVKWFSRLKQQKSNRDFWKETGAGVLKCGLVIYIVFNVFWGLNYNRAGVAFQFQLKDTAISKKDLSSLMYWLRDKVNETEAAAHANRNQLKNMDYIYSGAIEAYSVIKIKHPFLEYKHPSVKSSLFGVMGNYFGYTGYYNPFTGEAQVNTKVPSFVLPFTTCHEIGHQLGYAKENEANFSGFLAAASSKDPLFNYSVYLDLYMYGRPYLYRSDSIQLKKIDSSLSPAVKDDFKELQQFYKKYENPVEKVIDFWYGQFLKANQQPDGKITYSRVILWLQEYERKYKH